MLVAGSGSACDADEDLQVAAYYFPNWGPLPASEWGLIKWAKPQFEGHLQPKAPAWGFANENDPAVMARKIDAAAGHGIDAFIFDWYFFDPQPDAEKATGHTPWDGQKYLSRALEQGFLKAPNVADLRFALLWCNHDVGPARGAVTPATFETLADYVTATYFRHPSYWTLDGKPYFSIYDTKKFLESFGNDLEAAAAARPGFAMARSSAALAAFQLGDITAAEKQLRDLIRRYPLFADARAGLTALLWQKGARGEAESHWAAASGLDPRYRQEEWLLQIRRWPPVPVQALAQFLALAP